MNQNKHRIVLLGDSQVQGCSDKLSDILGSSCNIFGVTKPNANIRAFTNSINLKNENLTKKDIVIICGGTRDVAKNEAKDGVALLWLRNIKATNKGCSSVNAGQSKILIYFNKQQSRNFEQYI